MNDQTTDFQPDDAEAPKPGRYLASELEARGMTQVDLARRMGRPKKTINEIVNGAAEITPETALQLEHVLGVHARVWSALERGYRDHVARQNEAKELRKKLEWVTKVPTKQLVKMGWVAKNPDPLGQVRDVLDFYGIATPEAYDELVESERALLRSSPAFKADDDAVFAWLRQATRFAQRFNLQVEKYGEASFLRVLQDLRKLTTEPRPSVFFPAIQKACASAGVVVVAVPEVPGARVSGAARWITSSRALIVLSGRYRTLDHFWFTLFHEAGHIVKHGKKDVSIDDGKAGDVRESEANEFASDLLIPRERYSRFAAQREFSRQSIVAFAKDVEIAPGTVVGRLQHDELLPWAHPHNRDLKVELDLDELLQAGDGALSAEQEN